MKQQKNLTRALFFCLFLILFCLPSMVSAQSVACQEPSDCQVPAPTVLNIGAKTTFPSNRVVISGVSWNNTLIDVYIDGKYNGRAVFKAHSSGVGSFYYRPFLPLVAGQHTVYTVARNLSAKERSFESKHLTFTVVKQVSRPITQGNDSKKPQEVVVPKEEEITKTQENEGSDKILTTQPDSPEKVIVKEAEEKVEMNVVEEESGNVKVEKEGNIAGGVQEEKPQSISDLQKTVDQDVVIDEFFREDEAVLKSRLAERERENQNIGLIMLLILAVVVIIWSFINYRQRQKEQIMEILTEQKVENEDQPDLFEFEESQQKDNENQNK